MMRCVGFSGMCRFSGLLPAVGNSPPFPNESPFQTIRQNCQPRIQVEILEQMYEMEIRSENWVSCRRLDAMRWFSGMLLFV